MVPTLQLTSAAAVKVVVAGKTWVLSGLGVALVTLRWSLGGMRSRRDA